MSNFFGTVKTQGSSVNAPVYEGYIAPTGAALMEITTEGVLEGLQLQAALHVADAAITYTAVHESTQDAEAVLESVIGSTFTKVKDGLKKLWAKMKAWFKSVAKSFQVAFTSGKDFVKKFKKEIESKRAAGFEYEGHVWTIEKGNAMAKKAMDEIDGVITTVLDKASSVKGASADTKDLAEEYDLSEIKEKIVDGVARAAGVTGSNIDLSEAKEALAKAYRNNEDEKVEIKEFAKVSRATLIDLIEKVDKNKKFVDDAEKVVDKQFTEAIKLIDKLEKEIGKSADSEFGAKDQVATNRAKVTAAVATLGNAMRYGQSLNSTIASAAVESIKESAKEAESVLKSFVRFKGVKESFGSENFDADTTDVFESMLKSVRL